MVNFFKEEKRKHKSHAKRTEIAKRGLGTFSSYLTSCPINLLFHSLLLFHR